MPRTARVTLIALVAALVCAAGLQAQSAGLEFWVKPAGAIPLGPVVSGGEIPYTLGGGGQVEGRWAFPFVDFLRLGAVVGYSTHPTTGSDALSQLRLGAAVSAPLAVAGPLGIEFGAAGGYGFGFYRGATGGYPWLDARAALTLSLARSFGLALGASYLEVPGLYRGVDVSLGVSFSPGGGTRPARIEFLGIELKPVFPVFYKYYDANPVGTLRFRNDESSEIRDVRVTLFSKSFMDAPKTCASVPRLAKGAELEVPLLALFNREILQTTEGTKASAELEIRYTLGGEEAVAKRTISMEVLYRNAISWDDDRKAASFVTAKDPAILAFAKEIAGSVRERDASGFILQFRQALAIQEALSIYGMNYVVDPKSSYAELSASDASLDYMQFPGQSLTYRAGDCDDLTVLYCALLEAAGIETAFVTVPGHIYAAFSPGVDPFAASRWFPRTEDTIVSGGRLWIPVETTMVHDGFLRAWQEGARQWREASARGMSALIPVRDAWKTYEPTASADDARVVTPDRTRVLSRYDESWKRLVSFEIAAREKALKEGLAKKDDPAARNKLGVLYATYSLYDQAEAAFAAGARSQHLPSMVNLANIRFVRKDYARALESYQAALKLDPKNAAALSGAARSEYERENYAAAREWYEKLKAVNPERAASCAYIIEATGVEARSAAGDERTIMEWGE